MEGDRERFIAGGMDDYICKPVRIKELQEALSRCQPRSESLAIEPKMFNQLRNIAGKRTNEIIKGYLQDTALRIETMNKAIEKRDTEQLYQAAHALRSPSGNLGATNLYYLCKEMETIAREGSLEEASERILGITIEYDRVYYALKKELMREPIPEPIPEPMVKFGGIS